MKVLLDTHTFLWWLAGDSSLSAAARDVIDDEDSTIFASAAVTMRHAQQAGALQGRHRDPFDRMLIAKAIVENFVLVSNERVFDRYGVNRLW